MSYSAEPAALAAPYRHLYAEGLWRPEGSTGLRARPGAEPGLGWDRSCEPRQTRASEKEQLQGLNERFAGYIDRVRALEERNRALAAELAALRQRSAEPRRLGQLLGGELRALRARLEEAHGERAQAALERARLAEETQRLRARCEEEARGRAEAEQALRSRQQAAEAAARARADLERRAAALREELAAMRSAHAEQLAQLGAELRAAAPPAPSASGRPDLAAALRELRAQYEDLAARNLQAAEDWYRARCARLHERAARSQEAVRASRREAGECRRQLQARLAEMESLRGAHQSLERQLQELEERHNAEAASLQVSRAASGTVTVPFPLRVRGTEQHRTAPPQRSAPCGTEHSSSRVMCPSSLPRRPSSLPRYCVAPGIFIPCNSRSAMQHRAAVRHRHFRASTPPPLSCPALSISTACKILQCSSILCNSSSRSSVQCRISRHMQCPPYPAPCGTQRPPLSPASLVCMQHHSPVISPVQHQPSCLCSAHPSRGKNRFLQPSSRPGIRPLCPAYRILHHQGVAYCLQPLSRSRTSDGRFQNRPRHSFHNPFHKGHLWTWHCPIYILSLEAQLQITHTFPVFVSNSSKLSAWLLTLGPSSWHLHCRNWSLANVKAEFAARS